MAPLSQNNFRKQSLTQPLMPPWLIYALLSAFFAALVSILAKIGLVGIDSNLATAIRTIVIILFAWGIVFFQGTLPQLKHLDRTDLIFLVLSGLATGLSWLFYFKALQIGEVNKIVPIDRFSLVLAVLLAVVFLREKVTGTGWFGIFLIFVGTLVVSFAH